MNGLLVLTLLGAALLPYSVKQALADTVFRMDSGVRPDNNTNISAVDEQSPPSLALADDQNEDSTGVTETVDVNGVDFLDCGPQRLCSGKCQTQFEVGTGEECRCDVLCWFLGDCCLDYYDGCLQVSMNDTDHAIMLATLSRLGTYRQARILRRALKLIKLSACRAIQGRHAYLVGECGADPETEIKFHALHQKLSTTLPGQDINVFAGISRDEFIANCRGSSKRRDKEGHNLETIPVTLVDAYPVDFHNVFCAICNGIDPADVKYWESKIVCRGKNNTIEYAKGAILNVSGSSMEHCEALTTIPSSARMCVDPLEHSTSGSGARHHYPRNSSSVSAHREVELISTQSNSPQNLLNLVNWIQEDQSVVRYEQLNCSAESERARFCQMYAYSFYRGTKRYKNPHCVPCLSCRNCQNKSSNFWDSFACPKDICTCQPDNSVPDTIMPDIKPIRLVEDFFTASFRVVFDFSGHRTMVVVDGHYLHVTTEMCPENQTYVSHYQECREIVCPLGKRLVGLTCIADDRCSSGQGGDGYTCGENVYGGPFRERLALVKATKRITIRMRFRYILDIKVYIDANEATIGDNGLDNGSSDVSHQSYQGYDGSPEPSGDDMINKTEVDKFSILDINTMRSLWNEASGMRVFDDIGEAVKRLSTKVKETLVSHINRSGGISPEFHSRSDFRTDRDNSVSMSIISDFDDSDSVSALLSTLAHWGVNEDLTRIANENNFMLDQIEISSQPSDSLSKSDAGDGRRPCNIWDEFTYNKFKVYVHENGSHALRFQDRSMALSVTVFTVTVDLNDSDDEIGISAANVGVCQQHAKSASCSYVYFNRSDYVIYQDSLVTTTRAQDLAHFLHALTGYERRSSSLADIVVRFEQQYGQSDIEIHRSEYYVMADDGAFVCQNYSKNYNVTSQGNLTVSYSVMPTSFTEQVATVASLALSIVCLAIVLVVYGLVKELRNIPGKIVMSMSGALLLAQVIFLFSTYPRGVACQIYAAVQHALWLASFAWLAVMAVHLAYVLYFQSQATSASAFRFFSCLCWALPFLLVGCLFALDVTGLLNIQYGTGGVCWIGNARAMVYAFGVPLFTMLFATLVCAVFVVRAIRKSSKFRHKNTLNHSGEKTQILLCVNLSLLMGFNWVFYFLAVATDTTAMWTVFIVTNGSQGCYIFLCYVARRAILAKVVRQLNVCQGKVARSRYAQASPTVSHRVTKTTTLSPATSLKNLHLVVNPRSSPSSSPTPSPTRFEYVIAL